MKYKVTQTTIQKEKTSSKHEGLGSGVVGMVKITD